MNDKESYPCIDIKEFLDAIKDEWVNSPDHKETMLKAQRELKRIKEEHQ